MALYQIDVFDGVTLPLYNPEQELGAAEVPSQLLSVVGGGVIDYAGAARRLGQRQQIPVHGFYAGEVEYLVDEAGNPIVDEAGNRMITGTSLQNLYGQVAALTEKLGRRGNLERKRWDNESIRHWRQARLTAVRQRHDFTHGVYLAEMEAVFETAQGAWRNAAATVTTGSATAGLARELEVANSGQVTVEDGLLTITATAALTTLTVRCAAAGIDWRWAGALAAGTNLVVDNGARTIRNAGVDAYSGLTLQAGHTAAGWLPLAQGMTMILITVNAAATLQLRHYDQWL